MPRAPKPADRRQRTNSPGVGTLSVVPDRIAPDPPKPSHGRLLGSTVDAWHEFWASEVSSLVASASDAPALRRLFLLYDERERCGREAGEAGRVVRGSTGQDVLHPLYKHIGTLDAQITVLEDRFGLTPLARLKLGAQLGDAAKSLDEMNRRIAANDDPSGEPDPRSGALDAASTEVVR